MSALAQQPLAPSGVINENGKQRLGRNKFCKGKKCYKLSFITDTFGILFSLNLEIKMMPK